MIVLLAGAWSQALTISFGDFSDVSTLTLNGDAAGLNPNGDSVLRLTDSLGQAGSAFVTAPVTLTPAVSFSTFFRFRIPDPEGIGDGDGVGADGLVFVVQTVANTAGGGGGGLGYLGLADSVGVEFDTFDNGTPTDIDGNHVGVDLGGDINSVAAAAVPDRLNDGDIWHAWVDYNGTTDDLEVRLNKTGLRPLAPYLVYNVDLTGVLGTNTAFVGFTSGTGSGGGDHEILSWIFEDDFRPIVPGAPSIPEPGTLTLLGLGLTALVRRRRAV